MNWGYKILIGFSTFVACMLCMVGVAMKQSNEMIDDNYYEKELKYQDKIDASKNLSAVAQKLSITDSGNVVVLQLPLATIGNNTTGTIECIRSAEQKKDVMLHIQVDATGKQVLPKTLFVNGVYQLRLNWVTNGTAYFHQQVLNIRK
ncbi:MAG: FixH family protein [Flavobacterium sp.]|nr:FixH family protein [Flavobacterium sp.]